MKSTIAILNHVLQQCEAYNNYTSTDDLRQLLKGYFLKQVLTLIKSNLIYGLVTNC